MANAACATGGSGSSPRETAEACSGSCRCLDDFGLKPLRPPAPEDLYEIVAERYEKGSMMVTSNRAFAEWPELLGEPLLASAALDRLAHDAHQGRSHRGVAFPADEACP
jgi:IstB-like ATP binding protein